VRVVIAIGALAVTVLAGLGIWTVTSDNDEDAPELAPPPEIADPLPALPRGWTKAANGTAGFTVGVPPGWPVKTVGGKTTFKSPGSTVVVAITADRSEAAIEADLQEYAIEVAQGIGASIAAAVPEPPKAGGPGYESAAAEGMDEDRRVEAIVVRRPELAAYPIVVVSGAGVKPAELEPIVNRIVSTVRGQPPRGD
jgi:hypothetical protein